MFEKDLSLNLLFDTYGELLPENQRDMFEQYYCDDLSLSEIAENAGITRQGVRDRIDKARRALTMYEEKLGFYSCTVPTFMQYVLTELIDNGDFERHINRVRRGLRKQNK